MAERVTMPLTTEVPISEDAREDRPSHGMARPER